MIRALIGLFLIGLLPHPVLADEGLTPSEREQYYHLAEGSELFPLAWMKALKSKATGEPFLKDMERFGLIADPNNADGLPIGVTAEVSRGVPLLGRMVGINCAACHVGQITVGGKSIIVDGAPNLFDLNTFYLELFTSAEETVKDTQKLSDFLAELTKQGDVQIDQTTRLFILSLQRTTQTKTEELKAGEKTFAGSLRSLMDRAGSRALDEAKLLASGSEGRAAIRLQLTGDVKEEVDGVLKSLDGAGNRILGSLAGVTDEEKLRAGLENLAVNVALMKARLEFLKRLKELHFKEQTTEPGPGRIDAFSNVRDLVFPKDFIAPSSPVSFPHLWQLNQTEWLHWDGNTNSVMQRNVGQSMGLGAVFDAKTNSSSILPRNLHKLEMITRKLPAPIWPKEMFEPIDQEKAARGAELFSKKCAECHVAPDTRDPEKREQVIDHDVVGTDPNRALNFAKKLSDGHDFDQTLDKVATAIRDQAYTDAGITDEEATTMDVKKVIWRTTRGYVARPLVGVWATAPYLHNGSVPTLYDLLLPAGQRPKTFPLGHREYDRLKVGYVTDPAKIPESQRRPIPDFDTTLTGNRNIGHEYGTDLTESQRRDLVEHLKTL